jgi:hypothetical protein
VSSATEPRRGLLGAALDRPAPRFPMASGWMSRRVYGARRELEERRDAARHAAVGAEARGAVHLAASLRGKAAAYHEGVEVLRALDKGWRIPQRHWTGRAQ